VQKVQATRQALAMFKPDEAACLLAERFNIIGWIYKQEPMAVFKLDEAACLLAERFNMIGWIYK